MQTPDNIWIYVFFVLFAITLQIIMIFFREVARLVPANYIILGLFTICESYFVAFICQCFCYDGYTNSFSQDSYRALGAAAGMTLGLVAGITTYAWTTKTDFTVAMGFIWVFGMTFMMLSLFAIFFYNFIFEMLWCALGVLLFGIYLIIDTQLILGKGRYYLSIEDYILGAMILSVDIFILFIYIFIYLLYLCASK